LYGVTAFRSDLSEGLPAAGDYLCAAAFAITVPHVARAQQSEEQRIDPGRRVRARVLCPKERADDRAGFRLSSTTSKNGALAVADVALAPSASARRGATQNSKRIPPVNPWFVKFALPTTAS
jgi:hypothetical protein